MRSTIKDIALRCGVGKATVSRAINNSGYVKEEIKRRILDYVAEVGWEASSAAAALSTGKHHTVGVMVNSIGYYFNHALLERLNQKLLDAGYQTMLTIRSNREELERYRNRQVDGVVIFAPTPDMAETIRGLQDDGVKVVVVGSVWELNCPAVFSDKERVGREAMELCLDSTSRRILYLGMENAAPESCADRGERCLRSGLATAAAGRGRVFDILGSGELERLDAMLRSGDYGACVCYTVQNLIRLYARCRELGVGIPGDLAVVGVEGDDFFAALNPVPTHFVHDYERFAAKVVELLFNEPPHSHAEGIVPYLFVPGQSLGVNSAC